MPSKRTAADVSLAAAHSSLPEFTRAPSLGSIILHPFGDPKADTKVELVRPDDLLALHVAGYNLHVDTSDPLHPQLVRKDATADAYLVVTFPPQSLLERAYFEVNSPVLPPPKGDPPPLPTPPGYPPAPPLPPPNPPGSELLFEPGAPDQARLAGSSRLVFRVPLETTAIPYSTEGLLDWSSLELAVSAVAAMPESPTAAELAAAPGISRPGLFETAIEMPYRLLLSPGPDATWLHAQEPVSYAGRTELWHTRMALKPAPHVSLGGKQASAHTAEGHPAPGTKIIALGGTSTAPVRAIWSPDYLPADQPLLPEPPKPAPFRAPMTARDRHQIVVLTSAFSDYYTGPVNSAQPYVPAPVHVQRLMLSSLGGWLSSRGSWGPDDLPYSGVAPRVAVPWYRLPIDFVRRAVSSLGSLFSGWQRPPQRMVSVDRPSSWQDVAIRNPISPGGRLDLSEWVHIAAQGRDHYVRIVYEGYLYPFGHRAALIKVTERKFQAVPSGPLRGAPAAYLRQHMFIVVREPEKTYGDALYSANTYRQMPLKPSIRLTTLVTPNIDPPTYISSGTKSTGSFWVRVNGAPFNFHVVARDVGRHESDFTAKLIFVPFSDVPVDTSTPGSDTPLGTVRTQYKGDDTRLCAVPGKKVAYAESAAAGAEDTALTTTALYFDTQLTGTTPAHFLPILEKAKVTIPALKQIAGADGSTTIAIYDNYVSQSAATNEAALAAVHGVFATVASDGSPVDVTFAADRAGGFATPNLSVKAISRTHGPVGGSVDKAAAGRFEPADFFPNSAQLFGTIPLASVIPSGDIGTNAPRITTRTATATGGSQQIVTAIDWAPPRLDPHTAGLVTFTPGASSTLQIKGTVTTNVGAPQSSGGGAIAAADPSYEFQGTLTSFSLDLLNVIKIRFKSFGFTGASGQKLNVSVQLDDPSSGALPVTFGGPLAFVNALSEVIPQGGFGGDGPHMDVTPQQVEVGYTLGLPVVNIGVFALKDVTIAAGLDLPFTTGLPQVDFAFASRNHPFILTVECLGGGGFVHVQLNTEKVLVVEGQLEFGGDFSLDVGVASGGVHIMAGIYFKLTATGSDLTGFVDAGGELSVLGLISVSLDFYLSLSYEKKTDTTGVHSKVRGRATLTVAVHVAFFSTSVDVTVERSYGDAPGDPGVSAVLDYDAWKAYAEAFE